jgi:hypothetical protein
MINSRDELVSMSRANPAPVHPNVFAGVSWHERSCCDRNHLGSLVSRLIKTCYKADSAAVLALQKYEILNSDQQWWWEGMPVMS